MAAIPIAIWTGDNVRAAMLCEQLATLAFKYSQGYWAAWASAFHKVVSRQDAMSVELDVAEGIAHPPAPNAMLADMLCTLDESTVTADCVLRVDRGEVGWCAPEVLRAHAENELRRNGTGATARAEVLLRRSLAMSASQGALSWQLRSATSLCRLLASDARRTEGYELLASTLGRMDEGDATNDVIRARDVLETLRGSCLRGDPAGVEFV